MRRRHTDPKIERLRRVPAFAGLSGQQLLRLSALADETVRPAGTVLARHGRMPWEVFLVTDGSLSIERNGKAIQADGGFVGASAALDSTPHRETVVASAPVRAFVFDLRSFQRLAHEFPAVLEAAPVAALVERAGVAAPALA